MATGMINAVASFVVCLFPAAAWLLIFFTLFGKRRPAVAPS
ncbi:hypothetical protein [Fodinicola feengrottensis]|nr:hypothetical protein [Fodinicola feengrottensis]